MFPILHYICFFFNSSNEHGVHSPFIYHYLTNCLLKRPKKNGNKTLDTVLKSIAYFQANRVYLPEKETGPEGTIRGTYPHLIINEPPYDLVFLAGPTIDFFEQAVQSAGIFHNHTVCIINRPYCSEESRSQWKAIKALQEVRVTVDGFFTGLVFFRQEQARQHFKIRI